MMKKFLIILGVIIVALVIVGAVVAGQSGTIIQQAVVKGGPQVTGSRVDLKAADVSLLGGSAALEGLVIGNPEGFKSDHAFKIGKAAMELDVSSLFSDVIHIESINIDAAELVYELGKGGSNIQVLQKEIEKRTAAMTGAAATEEQAPAKKVIIDHVYINDTKVDVKMSALGGKGAGLTLPDLHLQDIGRKSGGATAAEAAQQILGAVMTSVTKVLSTSQIKGLVGDGLGDAGKLLQDGGAGAGDALQGGIDKVGKGLGGALKDVFR
ncbi:MAG: hypothetical protein CMF31_05845 [Kordiimonas sp.]|nr:hypothetical protein [Kordiimonas sp.]